MKFQRKFFGILAITLAACTSKVDKELVQINRFYRFVQPQIVIDSLPQNADSALWAFAIANPKHPQADTFAYQSILIKIARNHTLQASQWAEVYLEKFQTSANHRAELHIMGAHYYEQHQVFDRALVLYESFLKEFPEHEMAPQAKQMIEFINKGLITPEQQLEYLLQKKNPS